MQKTLGFKLIGVMLLAGCLSACTTLYSKHGYVPSDEELSEIVVGVDTRDSVETTIGPAGASGVIRDQAWYYLQYVRAARGPLAPKEIDRQLVAISFDDDGTVSNIERFTLEDGRVVALNRRVTDDNVKSVSFIRQLLGNLGNFTADQFLDGG